MKNLIGTIFEVLKINTEFSCNPLPQKMKVLDKALLTLLHSEWSKLGEFWRF